MSLDLHRKLLNDSLRMDAYRTAIARAVRPGDVVLDVGTGTGILAIFACQAGARRVYAVDRDDILSVARELARSNGFGDRITFIHQDVKDLELDEPVDVITSELIAKALLGEALGEIIGHCRDRFLKPGGRIVPQQVSLQVAPVDDAQADRHVRLPHPAKYGVDFSTIERRSVNLPYSARIPADSLLASPLTSYVYDAYAAQGADRFSAPLVFDIQRAGVVRGCGLWFSAALFEDVELTNAPPGIYSWDNLFLPLEQGAPVQPGMAVEVRLRGRGDSKMPFMLAWDTVVRTHTAVVQSARQSTFYARVVPEGVGPTTPSHSPNAS